MRGTNGSVIPSTPTVSMCALSISERPPPEPRAAATTLARPGRSSVSVVSSPARSHHSATNRASPSSPEPPTTTSGLIDSISTSRPVSSATSLMVAILERRRLALSVGVVLVDLAQEPFEESPMRLLVAQDVDDHVLRDRIDPFRHLDQPGVMLDRAGLGGDDSF